MKNVSFGQLSPRRRYYSFDGQHLVPAVSFETQAPAIDQHIHGVLRAMVLSPQFPCVGAKGAFNSLSYRLGIYDEMGSNASTAELARDLEAFVIEQDAMTGPFSTFVAAFQGSLIASEEEFERALWAQLQALNELDDHEWDATVSPDPEDGRFEFSFSGRAYFVVGLHPGASRHARRFAWPTLVFNAHRQFEALRSNGTFEKVQATVRKRDEELQGSINPVLANYGTGSGAPQYSGRFVESGWKCPFHRAAA